MKVTITYKAYETECQIKCTINNKDNFSNVCSHLVKYGLLLNENTFIPPSAIVRISKI